MTNNANLSNFARSAPIAFATRGEFVDWVAANPDPPVGTVVTAGGLQYEYAGTGGLPSLTGWRPFGDATPMHFGAAGDGVADDTAAIVAAISSGLPLDWGAGVYRITSAIEALPTRPVQWASRGAVIIYAGAHVATAFWLRLPAGTSEINGLFTVDADQKANVALRISNAVTPVTWPDDWASIIADDVGGINAYRPNQAFANGDGLLVGGAMDVVSLQRARARNCTMAEGADIIGSQGVSGITINRDNTNGLCVRALFMGSISVDRVLSTDPTVDFDQDGVRVFQYYQGEGNMPIDAFAVVGGVIRNSRNRSLKLQTQWANVTNLYCYKDATVDIASAGITRNADVDCQVSGGFFSGLNFNYDGYAGIEMIRATETVTVGKKSRGVSLTGLRAAISDGLTVTTAISLFASSGVNEYTASLSDIHIAGRVDNLVRATSSATGGRSFVFIKDAAAEINLGAIFLPNNGPLTIDAENVVNTLATAAPFLNASSVLTGGKEISARGVLTGLTGLTDTNISATSNFLQKGTNSRAWSPNSQTRALFEANTNTWVTLVSGNASSCRIVFGDTDAEVAGEIRYTHSSDTLGFIVGGTTRASVTASQMTVNVPLFASPPGPYANDAAAAAASPPVAVGQVYRVTGGALAWRQT
jgi:hypothetical protein